MSTHTSFYEKFWDHEKMDFSAQYYDEHGRFEVWTFFADMEAWKMDHEDVKMLRCDDAHCSSSWLVLIPREDPEGCHNDMIVVFIPQMTGNPTLFILDSDQALCFIQAAAGSLMDSTSVL